MLLNTIQIVLLLVITALYAIFDVFNKREVPNIFAYASVIVAALFVVTYSTTGIILAIAIALIIAGLGWLLYKRGFLGAGDVFELVAISLLMPIQPVPLLTNVAQLGLPFMLSVFIGTGYAAILIIVVYYLLLAKRNVLEKNFRINNRKLLKAFAILFLYALMILTIFELGSVSLIGAVLLSVLAVASALLIVFEELITYRMVALVYPKTLTEGDMIATNLMSKKDLSYYNKITKSFGRLATKELISKIKNNKKKIPVYRNAAPFAAFIFAGVVLSLLYGNLILLLLFR